MTLEEELQQVSPKLREQYLYLHAHHCAAQTFIGVARLHMTPDQLERMKPYDGALEDCWVDHLVSITSDKGFEDSQLMSVFGVTQEQLAKSRSRGSLLEQEDRRQAAVQASARKERSLR